MKKENMSIVNYEFFVYSTKTTKNSTSLHGPIFMIK
jgi:hypothetical protein